MFRFTPSRRAAILKLTSILSWLVVVAAAVLSIQGRSDVAALVAFAAVIVATVSGVDAYWAGAASRRRREA